MTPIVVTNSSPAGRLKRVRGAAGGDYPNEPSGMTLWSEKSMSGTVPGTDLLTSPTSDITGKAWYVFNGDGNLALVSDATAPKSPSGVYAFKYATGQVAGSQPGGNIGASETLASQVSYDEWYESGWFRVGGTSFETQQIGVKMLGYWGYGNGVSARGTAEFYNVMAGPGAGLGTTVMTEWSPWFGQQGFPVASRRIDPNLNVTKKVMAGVWHRYQMHMKCNTIGVANGEFHMWLDSDKMFEYTDMTYRTAEYPSGFYGRKIDPIWGGGGGANKVRDDYLYYDHVYISVK